MNNVNKPNRKRAATSGRPSNPRPNKASRPSVGQRSSQSQYAPIAQAVGSTTTAPRISGRAVQHSELIGSIFGSVAFTPTKYSCNPGIAATFPWLSTIASRYEKYHFKSLQFRFKTRTATTTVGSILMAPDYDPTDDAPVSEAAVSAYEGCVEDAVWKTNIICVFKKAHLLGSRFVRSAAVGGEDLKLFDVGNLFLCTVEEIDASAIGKLWVDYEVEFENPQIAPSGAPKPKMTSWYTDDVSESLINGVSKALTLADNVNDPLGIGSPVAGVFTPPRGSYLLTAGCTFSDTAAEFYTFIMEFYKNGIALATQRVLSRSVETSAAAGSQVELSICGIINCSGSDTFQIQVKGSGAAGTLTVLADSQFLIVQPA